METRKFNAIEQKILRLLYQAKVPLSAYEVAKEIGVSTPTAKKYLDQLVKEKVINDTKEGQEEKKSKKV